MIPILTKTTSIKIKEKWSIGKPFNPLTYDAGNLLALYNGDSLAAGPGGVWEDQSTNAFDLTLFNHPSIIVNAINGHDGLQFDGINQYGENNVLADIQPTTFYIVFKQKTWTLDCPIFDGTNAIPNRMGIFQSTVSPEIVQYANVIGAITNPNMVLNTYNILSCVFDGINSELRTNNNAAVIADSGLNNINGFRMAGNFFLTLYGNVEIAYLIIRSAADNTATQNLFINYLKNRFAI